jgi:cysteine-rich CPXCG protein
VQLKNEVLAIIDSNPIFNDRAIIESANKPNMNPPEKPQPEKQLSETEIDELYGLDPVIGEPSTVDPASRPEFVAVTCPYCGEGFETSADASAGPCKYVEDCQVCCQPIEMELRVDENGEFEDLLVRRGDSE